MRLTLLLRSCDNRSTKAKMRLLERRFLGRSGSNKLKFQVRQQLRLRYSLQRWPRTFEDRRLQSPAQSRMKISPENNGACDSAELLATIP